GRPASSRSKCVCWVLAGLPNTPTAGAPQRSVRSWGFRNRTTSLSTPADFTGTLLAQPEQPHYSVWRNTPQCPRHTTAVGSVLASSAHPLNDVAVGFQVFTSS